MNTSAIRHSPDEVPGLRDRWAGAEGAVAYFTGGYPDYVTLGGDRLRIAVQQGAAGPDLVLPFTAEPWRHKFTVGERRLGSMGARALRLANPWLAEGHPPRDIARLLAHVLVAEGADLLALGEIPEASALRAALDDLPWPARRMRIGRKESLRWLIDLPGSFDDYLGGLSASTRQSAKRKMRKLEKDFEMRFDTISDEAGVARFLAEGEKISRRTYQWNVGQRLCDDAETRARYAALAREGRLRCYLLSLDGTPRAFLRGTVEGGIYHYETPGFDPDFGKHSVGTVILLLALQELIENTACRVFDFGTGGDETGYKSTFGTRSIPCGSYCVMRADRPRGLSIWGGQAMLTGLKNLAAAIIPEGEMRNRLKRRLRKYGA